MHRKNLGRLKSESRIRISKGEDKCCIPGKRCWPSLGGGSGCRRRKERFKEYFGNKTEISEKLDGTSAEEKKRIRVKPSV